MEKINLEEIIAKVLSELKKETQDEPAMKEQLSECKDDSLSSKRNELASEPKYPVIKSIVHGKPVLITESALKRIVPDGGTVLVESNYILTPSARDFMRKKEIIIKPAESIPSKMKDSAKNPEASLTIAIGSDHRGFILKKYLKELLIKSGYTIIDVGTDKPESCDYPDFAAAVARKVSSGEVEFGIAIDSAGIGSAIAANKIENTRAAVCWDIVSAEQARLHNDANIMCIGADNLANAKAFVMVKKFIETEFVPNERYTKRLDKIEALERE